VSTETTGEGRHDGGLRDEGLRDEGLRDEGLRDEGLRDDADRPDRGPRDDAGRADDGPGRYTRQHGDQPGQHDHDAPGSDGVSVLEPSASERLRGRWQEVQAAFVDEPRQAVTEADQLVGEVLDEVSRVFRDQRSELEAEWSGNQEPGTEDLRQALRRYREFFDRLLSL
jgi:hypothetical protein